ncbi:L-rhamnose mutarotase [Kriegella aquimaris]
MFRKAFKMKIHSEKKEAYTKRHNPIWPKLEKVLKDYGES